MSKGANLTIVGRTSDGKHVVSGVYRFFETEGLPLDSLFEVLHARGVMPCWVSFYKEAVAAGMKHKRILSKLESALSDIYGAAFRDRVIWCLEQLHEASRLT